MRFFKEFYLGLSSYWFALLFVKKYKLWWMVLLPAILMLGIYHFGFLLQHHKIVHTIQTMNDINWYLILLFVEMGISLMFMNFSKYLMVGLLSPLLTYLSAKTEKLLTGKKYPFTLKQFKNDIVRAVKLVLRNLFWYYLFFAIIYLISSIFWENPKNSPIMFIFFILAAYYYGFSFLDYINERKKLSVVESVFFVRKHFGLTLGIGVIYSLMIFVPVNLSYLFLNTEGSTPFLQQLLYFTLHLFLWLLASFSPILACISASISMQKMNN
ncbi:MAG: EI24 domain-containing protein [Flavobacteriia bacterium]|nr:EI24 domain-containing protein [Flavobacteriia bacterium]